VPPAQAELFFVPVMLVLGFFERRTQREAMERWSSQVEAAMRAVGPFWDTRRSAHVMWSLRCAAATSDYRTQWVHSRGWPPLWDSGATLLCSEHASAAERGAGVLMPYPVGRAKCEGPGARPTRLFFAGSGHLGNRGRWLQTMRATAGCAVLDKGARSTKRVMRAPTNMSAIRDGLARAAFALHPRGDTSARKALYDALHCGTLPLFANDRAALPFTRQVEWRAPPTAQCGRVFHSRAPFRALRWRGPPSRCARSRARSRRARSARWARSRPPSWPPCAPHWRPPRMRSRTAAGSSS